MSSSGMSRRLWRIGRGAEDYAAKFLSKIPAIYHDKLHKVMQWGAALVLVFYEPNMKG